MTIRIFLVDDQYLIREGIASLLELEETFEVVGMVSNGHEAIAHAPDLKPQDVRMPEMNGVEATAKLKQLLPDSQVIMLTTFNDDEFVVQSLLAGACGYLLKDIPPQDLVQAIKSAHAGVYQLAPEVAGKLIGSLTRKPERVAPPVDPGLTEKELEVLRLLAKGATNKEIARACLISEGTVKNRVSTILTRLDLRDRTQAAVYAVEHGLG